MMESFFQISGLIAWLLFLIWIIVKFFFPNLGLKIIKTFILGINLENAIIAFLKEYPKNITNETIGGLVSAIVIRFTRIRVVTVLISLIPFILLYKQNELLRYQNEKFDKQNRLIEEQNNWITEQTSLSKKANEFMSTQIELVADQNKLIRHQSELLDRQNLLTRDQNEYSVSVSQPNLGVRTCAATMYMENNILKIESVIDIENFGGRPATEIKSWFKIIELKSNRCSNVYSESYTSNNPIFPDQKVDYVSRFNVTSETSIYFLYCKVECFDPLESERKSIELFYRYPSVNQFKKRLDNGLGLFSASEDEIKRIKICL